MIDFKFSSTEKEFLTYLGSIYKGKPLDSCRVLNGYVSKCGDVGLTCNINSNIYYIFFLDKKKIASADSSLPKLLTTINLLNKLLQSNDVFCLDKEVKGREFYLFADIENRERLDLNEIILRFKLKNDDRFHEFNRSNFEWRIYPAKSYQGNPEVPEILPRENKEGTSIAFLLNSTMVISNDLWRYIKNGCKTDEEIYNEKEAEKSKKTLFWTRIAAGFALVTLIVNIVATCYTREQAISAEQKADFSIELTNKHTENLDSIMQLNFGTKSIDSTAKPSVTKEKNKTTLDNTMRLNDEKKAIDSTAKPSVTKEKNKTTLDNTMRLNDEKKAIDSTAKPSVTNKNSKK